jgi:hypothetical protein
VLGHPSTVSVGDRVGEFVGAREGNFVTIVVVGWAVGSLDGEFVLNVTVGAFVMSLVKMRQTVTVAGKSEVAVASSLAMRSLKLVFELGCCIAVIVAGLHVGSLAWQVAMA